jgi:hypothetical protein
MLMFDMRRLQAVGTTGLVLGLIQQVLQLPEDQPSLLERVREEAMSTFFDDDDDPAPQGKSKGAAMNPAAQLEPFAHLIANHQPGQMLKAWTAKESQAAEEELSMRLEEYVQAARERCRQAVSGVSESVL